MNSGSNISTQQRIIIAGGGTGGHIFPAIAIANALKRMEPSIEILFIGAKGKMEMEKIPEAGYKIIGIDIAGLVRGSIIKNINLPYKIIKSFYQVKSIIQNFQPTAVIGVGGYSSFPVLRYAQSKSIPTFIHESNSFAGKSNKIIGKKAAKIFVATNGMERFFPVNKISITGNPVRTSIVNSIVTKEEALSFFGLQTNKKTLLVIGGSLGAKSINQSIAKNFNQFKNKQIQIIWQTGKTTAEDFAAYANIEAGIWVGAFITKMEMAYAAADVVISRAGAMSVAEICVVKKPVIFVPFPFAAEDHQTANAMHLVQKNAALLIKDKEAAETLVPTVITLLDNDDLQKQLIKNISALAITNADEIIAKQILNNIK